MSGSEEQRLFKRYVEVCNKALEQNKDKFPYKHLWSAMEASLGDTAVKIAIYDDTPQAQYEVCLKGKHMEVHEDDAPNADNSWHVAMSYLKDVVENSDFYIENPATIDWDWIHIPEETDVAK